MEKELKPIIIPIINEDDDEQDLIEIEVNNESIETRRTLRENILQKQEKDAIKIFDKIKEQINYTLKYPTEKDIKSEFFPKYTNGFFENYLGKRVEYLRNSRCLSKADIYKTAQIDRVNYDRIEKGETVPRISTIRKIIDVLDISLYNFLMPLEFEKWTLHPSSTFFTPPKNIYSVKKSIESLLDGQFYYINNGKRVMFSGKQYQIFMNAIDSALDILDLINHDED